MAFYAYGRASSSTSSSRKCTASPTNVSISGASARNAVALTAGKYVLKTTVDCYIKQGSSTVTSATTDWPLFAGEESPIYLVSTSADAYFAAITGGAAGTLYIKSLEAA